MPDTKYLQVILEYIKTPFIKIGVQNFPELTKDQNDKSFTRYRGSQPFLP